MLSMAERPITIGLRSLLKVHDDHDDDEDDDDDDDDDEDQQPRRVGRRQEGDLRKGKPRRGQEHESHEVRQVSSDLDKHLDAEINSARLRYLAEVRPGS